ncbi:uncharacterized protein TNCV_1310071 [Trichonephila clavipes]|nr:uncharacterized protein TNCV_1310071 [Trichonephila clavipes]
MQRLWLLELGWSNELPFKEQKEWRRFIDSLKAVNNISIDRCIVIHTAKSIELHAFSDASEKAYGSSIYLKSISALGEVKVCLVTSKSRVSPLKQISIPRLELCGAVLAAKLMKKVKEALNLHITAVHFWSDSTIVISWIHRESRELKTFVANRVSKIHQLSSRDQWHHIASEQNPADVLSRGLLPEELRDDSLWWHGPELLQSTYSTTVIAEPTQRDGFDCELRVFIENCRSKVKKRGPITTSEVNDAETWLIKQDQSGINLSDPSDQNLAAYFTEEGIEWNFIPPRAPHMGGLWEAGIKSVKYHLKRALGRSRLTYEEFETVIIQVEGILNSRPLTPISNDIDNFEVLTPAHFLIGISINSILEPLVINISDNRLSRWQRTTKVIQVVWKKWSTDYLNTLQQRGKWMIEKDNVMCGTMVIVKEDFTPVCNWLLGRVVEVYHGSDGKVRTVRIKTKNGEFRRPITKICILPIDVNN